MPDEKNLKNPVNDEVNEPKPAPIQTPKIQTRVKPIKPTLEGINGPKTFGEIIQAKPSVSLTNEEKELTLEPERPKEERPEVKARLMPQSVVNRVNKKHHRVKGLLITGLILLILIGGYYELYIWQLEKKSAQIPQTGNLVSQNNGYLNPNTQASSTGVLAQNNATSTASSTLGSMPFPLAGGTVPASGTPVSATTTPPAAPITQLQITSTPTGYLNVRSTPSTSGTVITQVHPGEIYPYTSKQNGWYLITLTNGKSGWVSGQYITLKQ